MTERLRETLDRLERILTKIDAPVVELLRPPTEIPATVPGVAGPIDLDQSIVELYRWHDGTNDIGGSDNQLMPGLWSFPPFETSRESQVGLLDELTYSGTLEYWRESWFPVLNAGLSFVAVDCDDGTVWSSSIAGGTTVPTATSLRAFFDKVLLAFEANSFRLVDGDIVSESEDVETLEFLKDV